MRRFGSIISREGSLPPLGGALTAAPSSRGVQGQSGGAPMQRTAEAWQPTSLADAVAAAAAGGWGAFPHAAQQGASFMDQGDYEDSFLLGEFGSSDFEDGMDVTGSGRGSGGIEEATSAALPHPGGGGGGGNLDMMLDDLFPLLPPGGGGGGSNGATRGTEGSLFPLLPRPRRQEGTRPAATKRMPGGREFGEVRGVGLSRRCLAPYNTLTE